MHTNEIRDRIAEALQSVGKVISIGNRVYFYAEDDDEFEVVVKTMQPKRPETKNGDGPSYPSP